MNTRIRSALYGIVIVLILSSISLGGAVRRSSAQAAPRTYAAVLTYEAPSGSSNLPKGSLNAFAPGNKKPNVLMGIVPEAIMDVSPDGKMVAVTGGDAGDDDKFAYGKIGQTLTVVPTDKGYRVLSAQFSANGQYLVFSTASLDEEKWTLNVIDLKTNKVITFDGVYGETAKGKPGSSVNGVGDSIGWSSDGKRLILRSYLPFSTSGGYDSLYALDMSTLNFDKPGRIPLPTAKQLVKDGEQITNFAIADDGNKVALMLADPSNAPAGYKGDEPPPNVISVRDLNTTNELFNYKAEKGKAFEFAMTWTSDSQKVIIAGGTFKDSTYIPAPSIITLDVGKKQATVSPAFTDPAIAFDAALACGDTLFFVTSKESGSNGIRLSTLYSAPLANLTQRTDLVASAYISLLTCISQ